MKNNISGVIIGKSFSNSFDSLCDLSRIIVKSSDRHLEKNEYFDGLKDDQIDIAFFNDLTLILVNDIRYIYPLDLSKEGGVFKFALSHAAESYVFDFYEDGRCLWDEYIKRGNDGKLVSTGSNVVRFQGRDINFDVFPAIIRELFKEQADNLFATHFNRFDFVYDYNK